MGDGNDSEASALIWQFSKNHKIERKGQFHFQVL
jgi:hypothetical protein